MTREIKHQVTICAPPAQVFEALMDQRKHAAFTGERATISRRVGSPFRCYGSYITGINLEIEPGKRIV